MLLLESRVANTAWRLFKNSPIISDSAHAVLISKVMLETESLFLLAAHLQGTPADQMSAILQDLLYAYIRSDMPVAANQLISYSLYMTNYSPDERLIELMTALGFQLGLDTNQSEKYVLEIMTYMAKTFP